MARGPSKTRQEAVKVLKDYAMQNVGLRMTAELTQSVLSEFGEMSKPTLKGIKEDTIRILEALGYVVNKQYKYWMVIGKRGEIPAEPAPSTAITKDEQQEIDKVSEELFTDWMNDKPAQGLGIEAPQPHKKVVYINEEARQSDLRFIKNKILDLIDDKDTSIYNVCLYIEKTQPKA